MKWSKYELESKSSKKHKDPRVELKINDSLKLLTVLLKVYNIKY